MGDKILLVEDEMVVGLELRKTLERFGYEVINVITRGERVIDYVRDNPVDLVLMDIKLEGEMDGIEATNTLHESFDIPVVFVTSYSDEPMIDRVRQTEACGLIKKPFEKDDIEKILDYVLGETDQTPELSKGDVLMDAIRQLDPFGPFFDRSLPAVR